jgi:ubiquinone/menaquinone biosynthesis C-methylase UbiE
MIFSLNTLFYRLAIDPLLSGLRERVTEHAEVSDSVLDVACGTGALALTLAKKAAHITGIDLSEDNITAARRTARRKGIANTLFEVHDASDLSCYLDHEFDIAVTSMAIHQFDAALAVKILSEMKRIAMRVIIADYNCPMRMGLPKAIAYGMEHATRGDHLRNFKIYMQKGGTRYFAREAGLKVIAEEIRGGGVFVVARCVAKPETSD